MSNKKQAPKKLYRSEQDRIAGGVAGGLGSYFELDPTLIRLIFLVLTIAGGSGILIYLVLWLVMPTKSNLTAASEEVMRKNAKEIEAKAKEVMGDIKEGRGKCGSQARRWFGLILAGLGLVWLLTKVGVISLRLFWPVVLILLGLIFFFN